MAFLKESQDLRIPFKDIELATNNFTTVIGKGGYGMVYKGELSVSGKLTTVAVKRLGQNISGQGFKEFLTEIQLLSRYKHPNLVSLLGFCEEGHEKILVYEYAEHGSLDRYLNTPKTTCSLTWKQRITICIDAARGLDYLHNHVAENHRVIHRDIKSSNILLDKKWKAMISDLGLSKIGRANENETYLITNASGTHGYCDPVYRKTGILTKESDVYSFGVVLFEVLCGSLCFINVDDDRRFLSEIAQRWYEKTKLYENIDPELKNQVTLDSMDTFSAIACRCLHNDREKRPSMGLVVQKLEDAFDLQKESQVVRMQFKDVELATRNFEIIIGRGGCGVVYEGKLSLSDKLTTVAVWRIGANISREEFKELLKEFQSLRRRKHPNLISIVGYCEEDHENILIYEYPEKGSLDKHLTSNGDKFRDLTWMQRLKICIDSARGLEYLHKHNVAAHVHHRVMHWDITATNILLNRNWKAKILDFGIYERRYANENDTYLITSAYGTHGYSDPGIHAKEVYSFGVVLFKVMCRQYMDGNYGEHIYKVYYEEGKYHELIDPVLKNQMIPESMHRFSTIVYQCMQNKRKKRPSMSLVVQELEEALELQMQVGNHVKVGPWGGKSGYPWIFILDGRITEIRLACGDIVDSITFIYTCQDLVKRHSDRYGGDGGIPQTIRFDDDEDITEISGTFGSYVEMMLITSLCFKTNKGTYGPFNEEVGTSFSLPVPKGKFIGFFGNCGSFLDSFGAMLQP